LRHFAPVPPTLLFDLDDTLIPEEAAAVGAFAATARRAAARHAVDPARLALDARARARDVWRAGPGYPYCRRIGISSWEGLWCRFAGDEPSMVALRNWAPGFRRRSWAAALADQGIDDDDLARELGSAFGEERRARHACFDDAVAALTALRDTHRLGLLTNGASCLQREKLAGAGLSGYFDVVVASGDIGIGKPDPAMFHHAMSLLSAASHRGLPAVHDVHPPVTNEAASDRSHTTSSAISGGCS